MRVFSALALVLLAGGLAAASDKEARQLYDEGRKAERQGQVVQAYLLYSQAAARDPKNLEYWLRAQGLRVKATLIAGEKLPQSGLRTPAGTALAAEPSGSLEPAAEERLLANGRNRHSHYESRQGKRAYFLKHRLRVQKIEQEEEE